MKRFREWLADRMDWLACRVWELARWLRPPYVGPRCPDCDQPEPECYCAENHDRDSMLEEAYQQGGQDAWQEAQREFGPLP